MQTSIFGDLIKNNGNDAQKSSLRSKLNISGGTSERFVLSGMELLTYNPFKTSPNECLVITRNIDYIDPAKKNAEKYADFLQGGNHSRIDKLKEDRQIKFRESITQKINDENRHHFNLKWKEKCDDIAEICTITHTANTNNQKSTSSNSMSDSDNDDNNSLSNKNKNEESSSPNNNNNVATSSFSKYDADFRHYLQNFNAIVVSKIKLLVEKRFQDEIQLTQKPYEIQIYHEATLHLDKFQSMLHDNNLIQSNDYVDRLKKLINLGMKTEHYPIFLHGGPLSGKTCTLTRYGLIAYKIIDPCMIAIRFSDLTSQCSNFEGEFDFHFNLKILTKGIFHKKFSVKDRLKLDLLLFLRVS
jgi:hypothetical protein